MNVLSMLSRAGLGVPVGLVLMLAMITVPLSPMVLDVLFTFNISLSLIVLLVSIYVLKPLDFAVFPSVILITTLMRLALNVASTRVVLLEGHTGPEAAGQVIASFGEFVIGGDYTVGLVVFFILVIINFVVVTKGAGRIAEVSARFTLDAMPGKQMAIDADLNAGLLNQEEARIRREEVVNEADFYGSMDGASKFVRGDAVAGILILVINIIGGLIIGIAQHDLTFAQAAQNYTLLTIGDGLAAQIPSLVLSTATAIIISRVSASEELGSQIFGQLLSEPRVLYISAGVMALMGVVPGMPNLAFLSMAAIIGASAYLMAGRESESTEVALSDPVADEPVASEEVSWDDVEAVDALGLQVGYRLISLVDKNQGGQLMSRIKGIRKKHSKELGFLIPPVHVRDNLDLNPNTYRLTLMGVTVGEAEVMPDKEMAINPGTVFGELNAIPTVDPAFGLPAQWVEPSDRDQALALGYTVVDVGTVISTHLTRVIQENAAELLGRDEVERIFERLAENSPKLVEELVPKALSMSTIQKVMKNLLEEGVSIIDIRTIAESLAESATQSRDSDALTMDVRRALSRSIVDKIYGDASDLPVITLDPELEQLLLNSMKAPEQGGVGLEPGLAEALRVQLAQAAEQRDALGEPAVLIVSPEIRLMLARFVRYSIAGLSVLAYSEIPADKKVSVVAMVGNQAAA